MATTPSKARLARELASTPSTPDALASLDAQVKRKILDSCDEPMAVALLEAAQAKQQAVLTRLKQRAPMTPDEARSLEDHVFREALGRLLRVELDLPAPVSAAPPFLPASPFAQGAKFDQLAADTLASVMRDGYALQSGLLTKPLAWQELLHKDVARAIRVGELSASATSSPNDVRACLRVSASDARERYPAMHAVADRLSCVPRELNYKTGRDEFAEVVGPVVVHANGPVRVANGWALAGYVITGDKDAHGRLHGPSGFTAEAHADTLVLSRGEAEWRLSGCFLLAVTFQTSS